MMSSSSGQFDFNHWLLRLVAYIIDGIIIGVVAGIIWWIITVFAVLSGAFDFFLWGWLGLSFVWGIIQVIYFAVLEVYWGASIGKRIIGLQVQLTNSGRVPMDKAFIRNISKILWPLLILDWLIGVVAPGVDRHQKYTDRLAGTTVVSARQAFSSFTPPPPSSPPPPPPPS
jgi:uncharacterized RDD family membrane protein YckC